MDREEVKEMFNQLFEEYTILELREIMHEVMSERTRKIIKEAFDETETV